MGIKFIEHHWPAITSIACGAFTLGGVWMMAQRNDVKLEKVSDKLDTVAELVVRVDERTRRMEPDIVNTRSAAKPSIQTPQITVVKN